MEADGLHGLSDFSRQSWGQPKHSLKGKLWSKCTDTVSAEIFQQSNVVPLFFLCFEKQTTASVGVCCDCHGQRRDYLRYKMFSCKSLNINKYGGTQNSIVMPKQASKYVSQLQIMWWITCVYFMYRKWGQWLENSGCSYNWFKDHICHFSYLGKAPSAVLFFLIIVFILKFNWYLEKTNKYSFCFQFYSSYGCYQTSIW